MEKQAAAETAMDDDRISQLPIPIIHQILCSLSQKEAVRTCILSQQWRHIASTRPNLQFSQKWFDNTQEKFVSVVDRTLQGYLDQNLSIHKLRLRLSRPDRQQLVSLLNKWIPIIALNIKAFKLNFLSFSLAHYNLPSAVFLVESLEELHLCKCKLSPAESVRFKRLRTLTLDCVHVDDGSFKNIASGCPLLRRLVLNDCRGLRNVKLSEAASPGLTNFVLCDFHSTQARRSIEINVPNLKTVYIRGPWIWSHRQSAFLFSRLTILRLFNVILSSESFDVLSFCCPTLASLILENCSGFEEFHLANDSVKYLCISTTKMPLKGVTICAPNILDFGFTARIHQVPDTFSFTTTTSKKWDSNVILSSCKDDPNFDLNMWFLELRRLLKPLSGSRIFWILQMNSSYMDVPCGAVDDSRLLNDEPPVVVESLEFRTFEHGTESWYSDFTNGLFRVCRPRKVWGSRLVRKSKLAKIHRLSEFQFNILLANMSLTTEPYFWQHDLEQVCVNSDGQLIQWTDLSELRNRTYDKIICLKLKWRGQTTT